MHEDSPNENGTGGSRVASPQQARSTLSSPNSIERYAASPNRIAEEDEGVQEEEVLEEEVLEDEVQMMERISQSSGSREQEEAPPPAKAPPPHKVFEEQHVQVHPHLDKPKPPEPPPAPEEPEEVYQTPVKTHRSSGGGRQHRRAPPQPSESEDTSPAKTHRVSQTAGR